MIPVIWNTEDRRESIAARVKVLDYPEIALRDRFVAGARAWHQTLAAATPDELEWIVCRLEMIEAHAARHRRR